MNEDSDVSCCVDGLANLLNRIPNKYMLMNGNVEKPLKFLVGSVGENLSESFSYAMDKRLNNHEIDMIGFYNSKEIFATEFKCTFSRDRSCTLKAILDACDKIIKTLGMNEFSGCSIQIVHFLNHSWQNSELSRNPQWIKDKCPSVKLINTEELISEYKSLLGEIYDAHKIYPYIVKDDLRLESIVFNLKNT